MEAKSVCIQCQSPLTADERAIYRKLINRGAREHMCISCLAVYLDCPKELIEEKLQYFKKQGCTLFENTDN